jgi:hypothetical protein
MSTTLNQVLYTSSSGIDAQSIYTDRGPISKPPLVLATGTGATLDSYTTVTLPGANVLLSYVGLDVKLTSTLNGGSYRIAARISATKVRLQVCFTLPNVETGTIAWQIIDPRDGQIADDPSDVTVHVNGSPVIPDAVAGLLGQIVLPFVPAHGDDVKVGYSWIHNPTVEVRGLNSKEFKLNNWNRDNGQPPMGNGHKYRYNNVLLVPGDYVAADMQAVLDQPLQRDLKYRAFERAYTPVLNDPNLLLLNSPTHKIAFPPLQRVINSTFVPYQALVLPENDVNPWARMGSGTAAIVAHELVVGDTLGDVFPGGQPIFWTRSIDLTFPHVFAATWQMYINATPTLEGVFSGVVAGYSDSERAMVVGYLNDAGTLKIGFLVDGEDPSLITSWAGGLYVNGNPTGSPVVFDWAVLHSYRIFRGKDQVVRLFVDGAVLETLKLGEGSFPFLSSLHAPFVNLEGVFFGSLSIVATSTSTWDFVRYLILPTNPVQTAPSIFVSYEGTKIPEVAPGAWTPVGAHGTETILGGDFLLLDSTSATTPSVEALAGLIDGDFRGFVRIEPLLSSAADVVLDVNVQLRTFTHGITPNALMAAIDDGDRLVQLCFFSDVAAPKLSYGGRTYPDQAQPVPWNSMGTAPVRMVGQVLRISDADTNDARVYFVDDTAPTGSPDRVVDATSDFILESRLKVLSFIPDGGGFAGATAQVYDGSRSLGFFLQEASGIRYITLHSDGAPVVGGQFAFEWKDGAFHTYRLVKSFGGDLVTLFVDGIFTGTVAYSSFPVAVGPPVTDGTISFGSSSPASMQSTSVVDWVYTNAWRVLSSYRRYVGVWKGFDSDALTGYHLPLKGLGRDVHVVGNVITDTLTDFFALGVVTGDRLIIDAGPNKGVYTIQAVPNSTTLTLASIIVNQPSTASYRIPKETDWSVASKYRVTRSPAGDVEVYQGMTQLIELGYNTIDLPSNTVGIPRILAGGLPSIVFGAFDPTNISQSSWDFVRYGITRSPTELRIVPHHQVLNQRNVMASPEHLTMNLPHTHTDFWSSSTGIPPAIDPDFLQNAGLIAFTLLNEKTPLVPSTQTAEVRHPVTVVEPISGLNKPEDVLNTDSDFKLNDGAFRFRYAVPDDVLYNSLQVIETTTGLPNLIAPVDDLLSDIGAFNWQDEVCLVYTGDVLPELDATAPTPWVIASDNASHVTRSSFSGILTYGTDGTGTRTIYRNATPLPNSPSLETEFKFRFKVLSDSTGGTGDSQIRVGFSAPGMTLSLAFVTSSLGERYILVKDVASDTVVGGAPFDFLDGEFHTYRLVRSPGEGTVTIYIDG